jgi:hypothetical protein
MAKKSKIVSYRRFENEYGNQGVKFIRINKNGERETRLYHDLGYFSYWRMIVVTDDLYEKLCNSGEEYQMFISYEL